MKFRGQGKLWTRCRRDLTKSPVQNTCMNTSVENVTYTSEKGEDYALMSGVFELGEANCDGFASALQLLYQMAGLECYKVYYHGSDVGSDVGHVWNIAVVDGISYHVDASRGALVTHQMRDTFSSAGADGRDAVSYSGFLMTEQQARVRVPTF